MLVHYSKDKAYHFKECGKGLYYLDVSNPKIVTLATEMGDTDYSFLFTVSANMEYFSRAEIEGVYRARDLKHLLGWPSYQQLVNAISKNFMINCPVLSDDVKHDHAIYRPATAIFKVGMVRKNPKHV